MIAGYQGEPGAFSEEAAIAHFGAGVTCLGYPTFAELVRAVARREVDYGLLPIENTIVGPLHEPRALLLAYPEVLSEAQVEHHVEQCLIGARGASLADVRRVISHPAALAQCSRLLARFTQMPVDDTALAARSVVEAGDVHCAAIGPSGAARRYGGVVLASGVQDLAQNRTRFAVIRHP